MSPEEQYKVDNYFIKIEQHKKCEGMPVYGRDFWLHVKKCESLIPEPRIK